MRNQKILGAIVILALAILACNAPSANSPQESAPEIQTAAAQTLQVIFTTSVTATVQQSIILPTTPSATSSQAQAGTITPTYSVPMLTVREQTNCRTGPGQDYEVVFTYLSGKKLEIVGRYDPDNYWLVKSDESPGGTCWLWGEYVDVVGSYWVVSSVTPPPTVTKPPPGEPSVEWIYECAYNGINDDLIVTLQWTDNANNETGFRVFRDGELIAELPADSTTYTDTVAVDTGEETSYRVEAYNSTGGSNDSTTSIVCN